MLINHFLIKEPVIKPFNKLIKCHIRELQAAQEVLTFLDAGHLDGGVNRNVGDWEVCVKYLIKFLFYERNSK